MSKIIKTKGGKMGFALVFTGLMFFVNPCVNLFDMVPDMFGALLIYLGLRKMAIADEYFEDARKLAFYLIFVYIAKLAFSFTVISDADNALPFTFIASVVELIFLIPFFHKLYAGFEYTLMRSKEGIKDVKINDPYIFTLIFVVVKCAGVVLVELFELITQGTDYDLSANAAYYVTLAGMKKYAILLSIIVQLILGVIFVIQMSKFFKSLYKHTSYRSEMYDKYVNELEVNKPKHLNRTLSAAYYAMLVAAVFSADFLLDGIDLLPDVISAALVVLSMYILTYAGDYVKFNKLSAVLIGISGVLCTAFFTYVKPEGFYLLSKEKSMFETHTDGFYENQSSVIITAAVAFLFAGTFIYAVIKWIGCNRKIYKEELMGNHDRKLLSVGVLCSLSVIFKALNLCIEAAMTHVAVNNAVSDFISDRPALTEKLMAERIAADESVALFTSLEGVSFVLSLFAVIIAVFAVFNIFALKAEAVKED